MTAVAPSGTELERFRTAIGARLGLWLDDARLSELCALLGRRLAALKATPEEYLALIDGSSRGSAERQVLAQELTITETYFFRQQDQIATLIDYLQRRGGQARVLCAACASGEEPFSIAIALREQAPHLASAARLVALDINGAMIERAGAGLYSEWALRDTPPAIARRWFRCEAKNSFRLEREIQQAVSFHQRNLIEPNLDLLAPLSYDAVFFRNALMYFTPTAAQAVIARIASALVPGGLLFLGYAETLRGLSTAFHLRHSRDTFFYQKRDGDLGSALDHDANAHGTASMREHQAAPTSGLLWYEAIDRATQRVRDLSIPPHRSGRGCASTAVHTARSVTTTPQAALPGGSFELDPVFDLLRQERFVEALDAMQALPPGAALDPDVLLLRGALLVHSGELEQARATCSRLLELDELNAGAQYLLALVCEGERDVSGSMEHGRIAAYLDPTFAMPRVHLGVLARRSGDLPAARRELRQAYALLEREDTERLVLFAGGFERAALLALCRAELLACGGAP